MTFLPNPDGHKDDSVHLVSFQNAAGIHLCTLWSYACHPTSCPERNAVSADFPGVVRRGVRKVTGQDSLPILFLQGFAGNLRPTAYDRTLRPISVLLRLLNGQIFGLFSDAEYEAWSSSLADHVVRILQAEGNGLTGSLGWASVEIPLSRIFEGSAEDQTIRLQRLALSENLSLIGVSAEVVAEYGDHVRALFGPATTIPVGHLDSVFGYLPTRQIVAEGGYEAGDFCPSFGLSGRFKPECEAIIVRGLRELKDLLI